MTTNDHAILVGLPRPAGPGLHDAAAEARRVAADLAAMRDWLLHPGGGGLAPARLHVVAPMASGAEAVAAGRGGLRPLLAQLEAVLGEMEAQARRNLAAGRGPRLGRRLTLYITGLGCLPGRYRPGSSERPGLPLAANAWLAWAQGSGMFPQVVLWLDCSLDRPAFLGRHELPPATVPPAAGQAMVALAARRPREPALLPPAHPLAPPRGALTGALLEGLRGAAADAHGRVTGRSLADWLRHASPSGAAEVIQADAALLLAQGLAPPLYPVRLLLPAAAEGLPVRLWHGAPPRLDNALGLGRARHDLALAPGLYVLEVPGAGLRQGFQVAGPTEVTLAQPGPPVRGEALGQPLTLALEGAEPAVQATLVDHRFALAARGVGGLRACLPFGLYKLRSRQGREVQDQVLLLDRDKRLTLATPAASPTPVPPPPVPPEAGEALLRLTGPASQGVSVVDMHGLTVLDLAHDGVPGAAGQGSCALASCALALPPGGYFLRRRLGPSRAGTVPMVEQSLVLVAGWALAVEVPPMQPGAPPPAVVLAMHRLEAAPPGPAQQRLVAALGIALADRRRILTPGLEALLTGRVSDPLAGILAGHLLLLEQEYDPSRDPSALNGLVRQLRGLLGPAHPDVQALALRCTEAALRPASPVPMLPMFLRGWRLLVAGSHQSRGLLPRRLWERAVARTAQAPFLAWSMDARQRETVQRDLAEATWGGAAQAVAGAAMGGNVVALARSVAVKSGRGEARRRALLLDVPLSALELLAEVYDDNAAP